MFTQILDRLGNWNPQLLREWNGRLKPLLVTLAIALSVLVQVGLVLCFSFLLPEPVNPNHLYFTTTPNLSFTETTSLIVSEIKPVQSVLGNPGTIETEPLISSGDEILAINGESTPDPKDLSPESFPYSVTNWAYEKLGYSNSQVTLGHFQNKIPLPDPITLELRNLSGNTYQVTLPVVATPSYSTYSSPFCIPLSSNGNTCRVEDDGQSYSVNWTKWYFTIFVTLTAVMVTVLVGVGGFMIFSDLEQEQRRGTLNFVRLSPRSPLSIVTGKILGVPALLYLSVLTAIPLHAWMAMAAGLSGIGLLAFYLVFSVQLFLFYSSGFLLTVVNFGMVNFQAWLYSSLGLTLGGGATLMTIVYTFNNYSGDTYPPFAFLWAGLFSPAMPLLYALDASPYLANFNLDFFLQFYMGGQMLSLGAYVLAVLGNCGLLLGIVYLALDRKFHNPGTTWIPRRYSYGLTIVLHLSLLLFAVPNTLMLDPSARLDPEDWIVINGILILIFTGFYLALLSLALVPSRQLLLDWLRFKDKTLATAAASQGSGDDRRLVPVRSTSAGLNSTDFILDCSSPLPPLILNLLISQGLFLGWLSVMALFFAVEIPLKDWLIILGCLGIFNGAALLLLFINQIFLLTPFKNTQMWTFWSALMTIVAHPVFMIVSYAYLNIPSQALLLNLKPEAWMMLSTLFLQSLGILGLGLFHRRQLAQAARSEWQELLGAAIS
ncbi:MAG: hypothetical protein RLZZ435_3166 [Cyanobacteriota bacterium]